MPGHAEALWNHALAAALLAEEIARETRAAEPHFAFLPGLFHDVGRIAFLLADDDAFHEVAGQSATAVEAERAWYGFDHAEAGAILAEDWGLAADQVDAIRWHHQPGQAERGRLLAAALNVADAEAYAMGFGGGALAPAGQAAADALGLSAEASARAVARASAAFAAHRDFLV